MNGNLSWREMMNTRTEKRNKLQTPTLVAVIVGLHVMAVGSVVLIQGCGTPHRVEEEPPPAPVMPPDPAEDEARPVTPTPSPVFEPPTEMDPPRTPADPQVYTVGRGDNLSTIARRHGVTQTEIMSLNQIEDPDRIVEGQELLLPAHAEVDDTAPSPRPRTPAPSPEPAVEGATYVVQPGDSLSAIAQRHGVSTRALAEANQITNPDQIRVDDELVIPGADDVQPAEEEPETEPDSDELDEFDLLDISPSTDVATPAEPEFASEGEPFPYTVRADDTLDSVAQRFAVLKEDLARMNDMSGDESLRPGQTLMIPEIEMPGRE